MAAPLYHLLSYLFLLAFMTAGWSGFLAGMLCVISLHFFFSAYTAAHRAWHQALTDELTKTFNYRYLEDWTRRWDRHPPSNRPAVSVLTLDLNDLKGVNDRLGHDAGNAVLMSLAGLLKRVVRAIDVVMRVGGDEFLVLLPGTDPKGAARVVRRIQDEVANEKVTGPWGSLSYRVAVGSASYPEDGTELRDILRAADADMYRSKGPSRKSTGGSPSTAKEDQDHQPA